MSMEMQKQPTREILHGELDTCIESQIDWYHQMQETQPVRYRPEYNMWEVFLYKDIQQVLLDYDTFSVDGCIPEAFPSALGKCDPPRHHQLRSLVSKVFTPRSIEGLTPRLVKIIDELLEEARARGKIEVLTELAYPLPMRVIAEMLGLPLEDQERLRQWSYQIAGKLAGIGDQDNNELFHYFSELLDERQRDPRDDIISELLAAEENGAHLTRQEIIDLCLELMAAGNVSSSMMLGYALHHLGQRPEIYQALRYDPSLIPGVIEETLRYDFSYFSLWRRARRDTVLGEQEIKAGQYVVVWIGAANFDKTYFPHPEQFDIRRSPNPHLTFGYGVHICLGYPLACLEGRIALERIVTHFSEIHLDPESPVQFRKDMGAGRMIESLGMLFTTAGSPAS